MAGDCGVDVPIEEFMLRVSELSLPSTASGVGRMAYGEGVSMMACAGPGVL